MLSWERIVKISDDRRREDLIRERAWVEIDLSALSHNVRQLSARLSPDTALMAVVKADAYGHGAIPVAQAALQSGASWLGVATVPEAIELRQAGITAPILVLGAVRNPEQIRAIARWQLQPTICDPQQAWTLSEVLEDDGLGEQATVPVHLELDTGMSRLGIRWDNAVEFVRLVRRLPGLRVAAVFSHFATADDRDPTGMQQQHQRFQTAIAQLRAAGLCPPQLHLANSAGMLSDASTHYDLVRVGLALYGLDPAPHLKSTIQLRPVLQVKARVAQVKTIPAGTGVSYGHRFVTERETRLAVVGIGYADGVPRGLSNRLEVLLDSGRRVPQIGAIAMDQLMLDATDAPELQAGDAVTLLGAAGGDRCSADDWANRLGTISWEILCGFKHRLPRIRV